MNTGGHLVALAIGGCVLFFIVAKGCHGGGTEAVVPVEQPVRKFAEPPKPLIELLRVEGRREIAPNQTVTVLRIPDGKVPNVSALDKHCLIYEHHDFRSVHVICDR